MQPFIYKKNTNMIAFFLRNSNTLWVNRDVSVWPIQFDDLSNNSPILSLKNGSLRNVPDDPMFYVFSATTMQFE